MGVTTQPVILGRIAGLFGVRGWVKVYSYTEPREAVLNYGRWLLCSKDGWQEATVAEGQRHGKTVIARIEGYDDRDAAARLIGTEIGVPREDLPETGGNHYYWSDLEGLRVVGRDGAELGRVDYLLETGANDVMVVKGEAERLIPFVMDKVVLGVDLASGEIRSTGNGTDTVHFDVISLFPEMVATIAEYGVVGRAQRRGLVTLDIENPRDHTSDVHRTVDDRPYGGGPGMVMKYEPLAGAVAAARARSPEGSPLVYLSPQGRVFDQAMAKRFAELPGVILLAGRYEGVDERFIESQVDEELSLGDFVLSGGEVAAMAVIDGVVRLLPGVLGDDESGSQDSFMEGLLDHPHYTRPELVDGRNVPDVLLSGDHAEIARWRLKEALGRTFMRRPDLIEKLGLNDEQQTLLDEFLKEQRQ